MNLFEEKTRMISFEKQEKKITLTFHLFGQGKSIVAISLSGTKLFIRII